MTRFKNIKKTGASSIVAARSEYKLIKPLAGPTREVEKTQPYVPKTASNSGDLEIKQSTVTIKNVRVKSTELKPKKLGAFLAILLVTITLQVILLVSVLYLSPRLIR